MATSPTPATIPSPSTAPKVVERSSRLKPAWQKYGTPLIVLLLAIVIVVTITRNWNGWEGGRVEQVTNAACVRGDLTPLSTKVSGLVRAIKRITVSAEIVDTVNRDLEISEIYNEEDAFHFPSIVSTYARG